MMRSGRAGSDDDALHVCVRDASEAGSDQNLRRTAPWIF